MNVNYINPFINSLLNVLETMATMTPKAGTPYLKPTKFSEGSVTGFICMTGEFVECTMAISFTREAMLAIASKMLGEEITELDDEITNLAGEITNMVTGGAKKELWQEGFNFDMTQPEFHLDDFFEPEHIKNQKIIVIPFESAEGTFTLEVCMRDTRKKAELSYSS
ncbi:MAG: chemotaxis protein CheX [Oleispira sp.]|jgi:chemotaxis protein CheX